jgi:tripartite-type tricarboxylate transporter receptor subunit TctC
VPQALAVDGKSDIRTIADLIVLARAAPSGINFSSGGAGSLSHLTAARLAQELKLKTVHIPFRGNNESIQAVHGGHVKFTFANIPDVIAHANAGTLRLLGVTAEQRLPYLPQVPTMVEQGHDLVTASWNSYMVPAGTPADVTDRLHRAFLKAASDTNVRDRLGKMGVIVTPRSGPDTGKFVRDEIARWRRVIDDNGIQVDN